MARRFRTPFRTSWRVGRFMGAETRLHVSFVVFVAFLFWVFYPQDQWDWFTLLMLLTGFFVSIALHELGHTLAARRCGLTVTRLVLWPLGGFRELSRAPEKPRQRFLIHAAGPLASLLCVLLLAGGYLADETPVSIWPYVDPVWAGLLYNVILYLAILNGLLVIANLLPVNPLDGGGMLEAILGRRSGKGPAETVSKVLAVTVVPGLVILGIVAGDSVPAGRLSHARPRDCRLQSLLEALDPQGYRYARAGVDPRGTCPPAAGPGCRRLRAGVRLRGECWRVDSPRAIRSTRPGVRACQPD